MFDLLDSKIVLPCYHVTNPNISLAQTREADKFKLYMADTGLLTTMLFGDASGMQSDIYKKLLSDKLEADLGYLYENVVAQMLTANEKDLYYHTWRKKNSTHSYEIDFLITRQNM